MLRTALTRHAGTCGLRRSASQAFAGKANAVKAPSGGEPGFTTVIGIEVHAQLQAPQTKLFSRAPGAVAGRALGANAAVALFDAALPGTYPVVNAAAVAEAVRAGLALEAKIAPVSVFERKHYYYYDLPSGYQITQQRRPLATGGRLQLPGGRTLRLTRLQLEQDSGKTNHDDGDVSGGGPGGAGGAGRCLVDLNRAGVALVEFVFEPDLRAPDEAGAAVRSLVALLRHCGLCDGRLEAGSLRVDLNVSVVPDRLARASALSAAEEAARLLSGNRVEVKNMNSVRHLVAAAKHEAQRQATVVRAGARVVPETRGWDPKAKATFRQRSKEDAYDYRFLPEPDLPPLVLPPGLVAAAAQALPELPAAMRARLEAPPFRLKPDDAADLVAEPRAVAFLEAVLQVERGRKGETEPPSGARAAVTAQAVATWILNYLYAALAARDVTPQQYFHLRDAAAPSTTAAAGASNAAAVPAEPPVPAAAFWGLVALVAAGGVNLLGAKKVLDVWLDEVGIAPPPQGVLSAAAARAQRRHQAERAEAASRGLGVGSAAAVVARCGWGQLADAGALAEVAASVVRSAALASDLAAWRAVHCADGESSSSSSESLPVDAQRRQQAKLEKFFVGAAMKASGGRAAPQLMGAAVKAALQEALLEGGT